MLRSAYEANQALVDTIERSTLKVGSNFHQASIQARHHKLMRGYWTQRVLNALTAIAVGCLIGGPAVLMVLAKA